MISKPLQLVVLAAALASLQAGGVETPGGSGTDISTLELGKQLQGPPVSIQGLRGKAVMLDFWGTH